MIEMAPCLAQSPWLAAFNTLMHVVQAVLLAALAQRAVKKNRQERALSENSEQ